MSFYHFLVGASGLFLPSSYSTGILITASLSGILTLIILIYFLIVNFFSSTTPKPEDFENQETQNKSKDFQDQGTFTDFMVQTNSKQTTFISQNNFTQTTSKQTRDQNTSTDSFEIPPYAGFEISFHSKPPIINVLSANLMRKCNFGPVAGEDYYYLLRPLLKLKVKVFSYEESNFEDCKGDSNKISSKIEKIGCDLKRELVREDFLLIAPVLYRFYLKDSSSGLTEEERASLIERTLLKKFESGLSLKIDLDASIREALNCLYSKEYFALIKLLSENEKLRCFQAVSFNLKESSNESGVIFKLLDSETDLETMKYYFSDKVFSTRHLGEIELISHKDDSSERATWDLESDQANQFITDSPTKIRPPD